jgi:hypothetical protein
METSTYSEEKTEETSLLKSKPDWKDRVNVIRSKGDCLSSDEFDSYVDAKFQNWRFGLRPEKPFVTVEETFGLLASDDQKRAAERIVDMLTSIDEINDFYGGWDFDHYLEYASNMMEFGGCIQVGLETMRKVDFGVMVSVEGPKYLKGKKRYIKFGENHDWIDLTGIDLMGLVRYEGWS